MSTYQEYAEALEARLGPKLCGQLGRVHQKRVGEANRTLIIGLGANFYYSNRTEALKARFPELDNKLVGDAVEYLEAVVDMRREEERERKRRDGRWSDVGRGGWMY